MEADGRLCYCGNPTTLRTSWTDLNPGRRFRGCKQFGTEGGCGFFSWFDPPICARGRQIIPGLLRRVDMLENLVQQCKRKEKWLWIFLLLSWFIVLVLLFNMGNDESEMKNDHFELM